MAPAAGPGRVPTGTTRSPLQQLDTQSSAKRDAPALALGWAGGGRHRRGPRARLGGGPRRQVGHGGAGPAEQQQRGLPGAAEAQRAGGRRVCGALGACRGQRVSAAALPRGPPRLPLQPRSPQMAARVLVRPEAEEGEAGVHPSLAHRPSPSRGLARTGSNGGRLSSAAPPGLGPAPSGGSLAAAPHSLHAADAANLRSPPGPGQSGSWCPNTSAPRARRSAGGGGPRPTRSGSISRPPRAPAPSRRGAQPAGGTESRSNRPRLQAALPSCLRGHRRPRGQDRPAGPPGSRPRVALETPGTPPPARSPGALSAPASRPAGPPVPRGSRSRAAAWCPRRGGCGAGGLTRPHPPRRARGSRARRPAAFGPAWEP